VPDLTETFDLDHAERPRAAVPVVLVNMPLAGVERPSLALSLLKAELTAGGIGTTVTYANLWFLEYIGLVHHKMLEMNRPEDALVDWLFSHLAFPDFRPDPEAFLTAHLERQGLKDPATRDALRATLLTLRSQTAEFIEWSVDKILAHQPSIVGCSTVFAQHVASLALLRRIRERAPHVITVMGGANCETVMGLSTHRHFDWVDYVVSGEADDLVVPLVRDLLARGRDIPASALPFGVLGPVHRREGYPATTTADGVPRAVAEDLRGLPLPDYSDYFDELRESLYAQRIYPGLPMEFSRGCWWGERSHCTFCGLNGGAMNFRQKPAEQAVSDMVEVSRRYGSARIEAVDNILAVDYFDGALPKMAALPQKLSVFFEVKSNLKRHEVESLAAAGIRWIQPGIESFDTRILKMMRKGVSGAHNVQLLKWARQYGVRLSWNLLWGFPGESDEWYGEMAPWMSLLHHFQPANAVRLRYQRYSPYHRDALQYGLKLRPTPPFSHVYPLTQAELADLVYYFEDSLENDAGGHHAALDPARRPGLHALGKAIDDWLATWRQEELPMLDMWREGDVLEVADTRAVATAPHHRLTGLARDAMLAADEGPPEHQLVARLVAAGHDAAQVEEAVRRLVDARLVLRLDGRLVALALWRPHLPMPSPGAFPGGFLDRTSPANMGLP
jgi:ribosomal peptide maturation radical SAM protein 1